MLTKRRSITRKLWLILGCLLILVSPLSAAARNARELQSEIARLEGVRDSLNEQIQETRAHIRNLQAELLQLTALADSIAPIPWIIEQATSLKMGTHSDSEWLGVLPKGSEVLILAFAGYGYWIVDSGEHIGYLKGSELEGPEEMARMQEQWWERFRADQKAELEEATRLDKEARAERLLNLTGRFGEVDARRILRGKIWIGMTDEMATESLGAPENIYRTVSARGVSESWNYGRTSLYFQNGLLKLWTD